MDVYRASERSQYELFDSRSGLECCWCGVSRDKSHCSNRPIFIKKLEIRFLQFRVEVLFASFTVSATPTQSVKRQTYFQSLTRAILEANESARASAWVGVVAERRWCRDSTTCSFRTATPAIPADCGFHEASANTKISLTLCLFDFSVPSSLVLSSSFLAKP